MQDVYSLAKKVKLLICDVDGVMTSGALFFGDDGQEYKAFHSRDGHGMKMLQNSGVKIAIITGRESRVVEHRMKNLNIDLVYQGQHDKTQAFALICNSLELKPEEIAYIGDDVVDLPVMKQVGFAIAVADAHELVKERAHWITPHMGGQGAVRDLCEMIMKAQGTLDEQLALYL